MTIDSRTGGLHMGLLSKYRSVLMGAAILMTMFCHLDVAQSHNGIAVSRLASFLHTFTVGVDIFLFLSGIGLYYSYTRRPLKYLAFEKRRIMRIVPSYLIIAGVTYVIFDIFIRHQGLKRVLMDLSFASWPLVCSTRYWYILASVVFYLLFPLAYRLIHGGKNRLLPLLVFCAVWWFAGETVCLKFPGLYTFRLAIARLPIFLIGVYCGKLADQNAPVKTWQLVPAVLTGYAALIVLKRGIPDPFYGYLYYPVRGMLAVSIMASVILVMELLERKLPKVDKLLFAVLSWFGALTLELYLFHQSSLILLDYPCSLPSYTAAAFLLPTAAAAVLYLIRKKCRKAEGK